MTLQSEHRRLNLARCIRCGEFHATDKGCNVRSGHIAPVVRSNATTGWIKVSERLPEEGIYVIAFEPHCVNNPDKGIGICEVDSDFTAKKSDGSFWITHWMPLPEPPEV